MMRRILLVAILAVALAIPTVASAAPKVDSVTGGCTTDFDGDIVKIQLNVFEARGTPSAPGYMPSRGWIKISGFTGPSAEINGIWPAECNIFVDPISGETVASVWLVGMNAGLGFYDLGEPGVGHDRVQSFTITKGNIKIRNYPDDGD